MKATKRHIDARLDQIDVAIIENDLNPKRGMRGKETAQPRHDVQSGKRHGRADAQLARETRIRAAGGDLGLIRFFYYALGSFEEVLTRSGGCQPLRGTNQQLHAQALFELRDRFRHGRLPHVQLARGGGERAGLHDAYEGLHRRQTIQPASPN